MRRDMIPLAAGLSLFALGFGVPSVMYAVMDPSPELPGLYSFRSATIGDGVLLPLLMFISLSSMARFQRIVAPRPRPAIGAGLVGALVGLGTQVQWLRDDHTVLNWTIPHQHEFNAAGWYHAVFLVTACALLTGTATGALLQIRDLLRTTGPASHSEIWTPYLLGILITIVGFVGLLFLDNAEIGGWGATSLAVVLVLLAVTLGVLVWAIFGMARPGERLFVWIATTSVAIAISMLFWHGPVLTNAQILALAVGLIAGCFQAPLPGMEIHEQLVHGLMVGLCIAGPLALGVSDQSGEYSIFGYLAIAFVLTRGYHVSLMRLRYSGLHRPTAQRGFVAAVALLYLIYTGLVFANHPQLFEASGANIWIGIASLWAIDRLIMPWALVEMNEYKAFETATTDRHAIRNRRAYLYITVAPALLLALGAVLSIGNGTIAPGNWQTGHTAHFAQVTMLGGLICAFLFIRLVVKPISVSVATVAVVISMLTWIFWAARLVEANWPASAVHWIFAVVLSLGVGAFVGEGFVCNMSTIHVAARSPKVMLLGSLVAASAGCTSLMLLTVGVGNSGDPASRVFTLVTAILALAANLSITWSAAACLPATQDGFVSCHKDSPMGGALQDALIGCLMAIFFGLGPLFALVGIDDNLIWLAYYLLYLGFLSLGATYLIHANLEFLVHRRSEGPLDPRVSVRTNDQAVRALTRHIRFQNVLCGVILFPLVIKQFLEDKDDRVEANMPGGIFESLKALMQD